MYKMLLLLKKTEDEFQEKIFEENIVNQLSEATGKKLLIGKVDSSLLLENEYLKFCEVNFASKDEMDELLASAKGKEFSKNFSQLAKLVTVILVNYEN